MMVDDRPIERQQRTTPWYKDKETRLTLILITLWITAVLLVSIAMTVRQDVRLNKRIENRQIFERARLCLVVSDLHANDAGLCSAEEMAAEDR